MKGSFPAEIAFQPRSLRIKIILFKVLAFFSIILAFLRIVIYENYYTLPLIFFSLGFVVSYFNKKKIPHVFLFLLPFINSSPAFFYTGYPHNYMAPVVFLLSGIFVGLVFSRDPFLEECWDEGSDWYLFFFIILLLSVLFLFLRWSNLTIAGKAFGSDTPVSPKMERISFGSIFPVVTVFLYGITPLIFFYFRKIRFAPIKAFEILSYGFYISVGMAIFQKIFNSSFLLHRIIGNKNQYNGGFSDFNSLGFFSGFMFVWATEHIRKKRPIGVITLVMALAGIFWSGSRAAFFLILIGLINLFIKLKAGPKKRIFMFFVIFVLLMVLIAGGTFRDRLLGSLGPGGQLYERLNKISNGRLWMSLFSLQTIRDFYFTGIGAGNFTFFLDYKNFKQEYVYDLALNQYLQVFTETGFWGFSFFIIFLTFIFFKSNRKLFIGAILFMLIFNNYFWFPEIIILFWLVAALFYSEKKIEIKPKIPLFRLILCFSVLSFVFGNVLTFSRLHPKNWALEKGVRYDYGFWISEKNPQGKTFRWTKYGCGFYTFLNQQGESLPFHIWCGAPLLYLPEQAQVVTVYWRGKRYREFIFKQNRVQALKLYGKPYESGFLELRIKPAFSLKALNLGKDERYLGVQFMLE